jgi:hypothetical protein
MASAKDTFEPKTFQSNTFACGTWRGVSGDVAGITEYVTRVLIIDPIRQVIITDLDTKVKISLLQLVRRVKI